VAFPTSAMFVDDDEIDQMFYERNIARRGAIEKAFHFFKAEEALDFITSGRCPAIDVVVLDVRMPGMDGFAFLQLLAESPSRHVVERVAVMMTVPLPEQDRARMRASGLAPVFLEKPLDLEALREMAASTAG